MKPFCALLIDDEEELVSTLQERLEFRGIEAEFYTNGHDAIARARERDFDVVILDLKMPGMSGLEAFSILKADHPNVPIIFITGHGKPSEEQIDVPTGAFDYLPKPVSLEILIQRMQDAVEASNE